MTAQAPATTILPRSTCPACSSALTACTGPGSPRANDLAICWSCGELLTFDAELRHQRLPAAELELMDPAFRAWVLGAQQKVRARRAWGRTARA